MTKSVSKLLAMVLALAMVFALCACGSSAPAAPAAPAATEAPAPVEEPLAAEVYTLDGFDAETYFNVDSAEKYDAVLGEFMAAYEKALDTEISVSERYALMAVAEAKLMESGVMFPTSSQGGMYAISRVAPYTITSVLWGNDSYRYHQAIVATEPITSEDRAEMKAMWNELRGTGTYESWVKEYLTGKGYELKDSYSLAYPSDPQSWDVLATSRAADSEAIVNTYDGLYEYDVENGFAPALATSCEVSEDGLTYTLTLREGAVWVDSQGRKVADVVADDFVAGMQHMMDCMGGLEYLVQGVIVNADEYINGEVTDFAEVGVKAVDDYTLEYTLCQPAPYFTTMFGYGVFAPMSRSYYESQGGKFGAEFDASAEGYLYGSDPDHIAYNGPYVVTNNTPENTIVFSKNDSYWNADNINLSTITWLFNDGTDELKLYTDMQNGVVDGCSLTAARLEAAKKDGWFDQYVYTSLTDATSYMGFLNFNRNNYSNINDTTTAVSALTVSDADRANAAMMNQHFRLALCMALDRGSYNAQVVGEELKYTSVINSYTPGNFVYVSEDTTISINGSDVTFPAGTYYGEIMQAQLDADGVALKVWDADEQSSAGFDGWYNAENAQAELALAVAELAEQGVEISAENPIYIDLPTFTASTNYNNKSNVLKQSVEAVTGGAIIINIVDCPDAATWYYAGYYTDYGYEANYGIYDLSGWGPDYGDPQTYLDTFLPEGAGYMVKCVGVY